MKLITHIIGAHGLSNFGIVKEEMIFRGAQPTLDGYTTLKLMGIASVLNLRKFHDDKKMVEKAGMKSFQFPMTVFSEITNSEMTALLKLIEKNQPIFIHCQQGHDRTGAVVGCYRKRRGWDIEDILAELELYGYNNLWTEMKELILDYK